LLADEITRRLHHLAAGYLGVAVDFDNQHPAHSVSASAPEAGEIALAGAEQRFLSTHRVAQVEQRMRLPWRRAMAGE